MCLHEEDSMISTSKGACVTIDDRQLMHSFLKQCSSESSAEWSTPSTSVNHTISIVISVSLGLCV